MCLWLNIPQHLSLYIWSLLISLLKQTYLDPYPQTTECGSCSFYTNYSLREQKKIMYHYRLISTRPQLTKTRWVSIWLAPIHQNVEEPAKYFEIKCHYSQNYTSLNVSLSKLIIIIIDINTMFLLFGISSCHQWRECCFCLDQLYLGSTLLPNNLFSLIYPTYIFLPLVSELGALERCSEYLWNKLI